VHLRHERAIQRNNDSPDEIGNRIKMELEQLRAALRAAG
jgi:hypothetical protein